MNRRIAVALGLALLLASLPAPSFAQTTISGSLQGTVHDKDGGPLPGTTVTVTSDALVAGRLSSVADARGNYRFPSLPPGAYAVEAELSGFQKLRPPEVRIRLGQALVIDFTLPMSQITEQITVTAEAPVLSVVNNAVSTNFDQQFLEVAPLQRNFYNIIKAAPGVNIDYTSSSGSAMLAYGGTGESQNGFTLDGVNVADAAAGEHWILPSIQWMQEIEIGGLGANAEYGGYTGGLINGVTKSGGNQIHGGFEYYYQPAGWTSNNDPTGNQPTFKFSDAAVSFGGPVVKDKLWYFISGEYWHQETTPLGAVDTSDRKIPRTLGKLTYQANPANRLMLMGEWDSVTNERRGIGELTLPDASSKQKAPGVSFALHWESLVNANNFGVAKLTGYDGRDDYLPYHGTDLPGRIDEGNNGIAWQNQDIQQLNHRHIVTASGAWSWYKDSLFGAKDYGDWQKASTRPKLYNRDGLLDLFIVRRQ